MKKKTVMPFHTENKHRLCKLCKHFAEDTERKLSLGL